MRNFIQGILFSLVLVTGLFGQIYPSYNYEPSRIRAIYNFEPVIFEQKGLTRVSLFIYVPATSITFVRDGDEYTGEFTYRAGIYDRKRQIVGDTGVRRVSVEEYRKTKSPGNEYLDSLVFEVEPGEYDIHISVTDRNGSREMPLLLDRVRVPSMAEGWALGNPVFLDSLGRPMSSVDTGDSVTIKTAYMAEKGKQFVITHFFEDGDFSVSDTLTSADGGRGQYEKKIMLSGVTGGERDFRARLDVDGKAVVGSGVRIRFRASYSHMSEDDVKSELFLLSMVGVRKEIKAIENSEPEERDSLVAKLWKKRDPTPDTERNEFKEEFLRRVEYANENFSGLRPGYRTDMGRIYIEYGPPDEIERHPFDPDTYAYVKWYYYTHHSTYTFVDKLGDGDYVLWSVD